MWKLKDPAPERNIWDKASLRCHRKKIFEGHHPWKSLHWHFQPHCRTAAPRVSSPRHWDSSFLYTWMPKVPLLPFSLKNILCQLLWWPISVLIYWKISLLLLHVLKYMPAVYRFLGWQLFPGSTLKTPLHHCLASFVANENSAIALMNVLLHVKCFFLYSFLLFIFFPLYFIFSSLIIMFRWELSFFNLVLSLLSSFDVSFHQIWKNCWSIFLKVFYDQFSLFVLFNIPIIYMIDCLIILPSLKLCLSFQYFSTCFSLSNFYWSVSKSILFSVVFNLLLIPFSNFLSEILFVY